MTTLVQATGGARRVARSAALRNLGIRACPFPADGTPMQRACRRAWFNEYLTRRPPAPGTVDFRSDLQILADGDDQDDG